MTTDPQVALALIALADKAIDHAIPIMSAIGGLVTLCYQIWMRHDSKKGREDIKGGIASLAKNVDVMKAVSGFSPLATQTTEGFRAGRALAEHEKAQGVDVDVVATYPPSRSGFRGD